MHLSLHVSYKKKRSHVIRVFTSVFECIFMLKWSRQTGRWKLILPVLYTFELKKNNFSGKKGKLSMYSLRMFNLVTCRHSQFLIFALKKGYF